MRSLRASISAAISVSQARRAGSARAGTCADHGRDGSGTGEPVRWRMRASRTAGMSRAPARSRSAIASARIWAGSWPASSAARRVRHSHLAWWPGSARWPGGSAAASRSRYRCWRAGTVSAVQIACRRARWSASARAWWRVWVAESCWPSWSSTAESTLSAVSAGAGGVAGAGPPPRSAWIWSYRASSGAGRGPGTGSARFGDCVNTYARLRSVPRVRAT